MHGNMKVKLQLFAACFNLHVQTRNNTDTSGRAVLGKGLRPLDCWDCGFESCR